MRKLMHLSDIKDLKVKVLFNGKVDDNSKKISYDDARFLCDLQEDFGRRLQPNKLNLTQIKRYNNLVRLRLLNQLETGEYGLSRIAQRARYLID